MRRYWHWLLLGVFACGGFLFFVPVVTPKQLIWVPGQKDSRCVGEWKTPLRSSISTTIIRADGTGRWAAPFEWGTKDGDLHLRVMSFSGGWYGTRASYTFSPDRRSVNLGDEYIGIPLRLYRMPEGPMVNVGRVVANPPNKTLEALRERGIPCTGNLVQVPKPWIAIGRDACQEINDRNPGSIELLTESKAPNHFPTYPHVRIDE